MREVGEDRTSDAANPSDAALAEAVTHEERTLRTHLRALLRLPFVPRLALGLALLQTVVTAVLLVLGNGAVPGIPVDLHGGHLVSMSAPALIVGLLFWVLGWGTLLTGAIHGHAAIRLIVLMVFTALVGLLDFVDGTFPTLPVGTPLYVLYLAPVALIWLWALLVTVLGRQADRPKPARPGVPLPLTWAVVTLLVAAHFAVVNGIGARDQCPTWICPQGTLPFSVLGSRVLVNINVVNFFFVLLVMLAGARYVDWGQALATGLQRAVRRRDMDGSRYALVACGIGLVALGLWRASVHGARLPAITMIVEVVGGAALLLVIGWGLATLARGVRRRAGLAARLPSAAIALAGLFGLGAVYAPAAVNIVHQEASGAAGLGLLSPNDFAVYQHPATAYSPTFSFAHLDHWVHVNAFKATGSEPITLEAFRDPMSPFTEISLFALPLGIVTQSGAPPGASDLSAQVTDAGGIAPNAVNTLPPAGTACAPQCSLSYAPVPPAAAVPSWSALHLDAAGPGSSSALTGEVWWRASGGYLWAFCAVTTRDHLAAALPALTAAVSSWRPDLNAAPTFPAGFEGILWFIINYYSPSGLTNQVPANLIALLAFAVPGLLGLGAGLALLARGGPPERRAIGLFLTVFGAWMAIIFPLWNSPIQVSYTDWLFLAAGVLSLGAVLARAVRRGARTLAWAPALLALDVTLLALFAINAVFSALGTLRAIVLAQAALLLLAFLWHLVTDRSLVGDDGREAPRQGGFLAIGRGMLSTTFLLFAVLTPRALGLTFDLGNWGSVGIVRLAMPLAVALFLLAVVNGCPHADATREPSPAPDGEGAHA